MKRWYSARGARRGLLLAVLAVAVWTAWAVGYMEGVARADPQVQQGTTTHSPSACCASGTTS